MDVFGEIRGQSADGPGGRPRFPELPILSPGEVPPPAATPRGQREKYGALFYLGLGGLVVLAGLIAWFGAGLWSNRDVWADVFILNDPQRPEPERLDAAERLSRNPRLEDTARMEMALRKDLPARARYLLAESISTELPAHDPRSYAMTVARSEGWPDWLRLLLSRRLAYGAGRRYDIPRAPLDELAAHKDPIIALWARYALWVISRGRVGDLATAAGQPGASGELARMLIAAEGDDRERRLDEATAWLRDHHPQAAEIWRDAEH